MKYAIYGILTGIVLTGSLMPGEVLALLRTESVIVDDQIFEAFVSEIPLSGDDEPSAYPLYPTHPDSPDVVECSDEEATAQDLAVYGTNNVRMIESSSGTDFVAIFAPNSSSHSPLLALGWGGLWKRVCKIIGKEGDDALRLLLKALAKKKIKWTNIIRDLGELINPSPAQIRALCVAQQMIVCLNGLFVVPGMDADALEEFCRKQARLTCI